MRLDSRAGLQFFLAVHDDLFANGQAGRNDCAVALGKVNLHRPNVGAAVRLRHKDK